MMDHVTIARDTDTGLYGFSMPVLEEVENHPLFLMSAMQLRFPNGFEIVAGPVYSEVDGREYIGYTVKDTGKPLDMRTGEADAYAMEVEREDRAKQQS